MCFVPTTNQNYLSFCAPSLFIFNRTPIYRYLMHYLLMQSIHMSWCLTPKLKSCVRAYVRVEHEVRGNLKSTCVCHRRSCIAELMADHMYYIYKSCPPVPVIRLLTSNYMMLTNFYICSLIWTPTRPMTKSLMWKNHKLDRVLNKWFYKALR